MKQLRTCVGTTLPECVDQLHAWIQLDTVAFKAEVVDGVLAAAKDMALAPVDRDGACVRRARGSQRTS